MTVLLPTYDFEISYGASDDRLHRFYIPALERSVQYERSAGFFSSASLAIAATGITRLIQNDGRMRLLVGAQLSEDDVEAISRGSSMQDVVGKAMVGCLGDPSDGSIRARLEALAWMVAQGRLEIRVVLPRDSRGLPIPARQSREYFHIKEGVFTDAEGNRLGFSGSCNESEAGWEDNYEALMTYASWDRVERGSPIPALVAYLAGIETRFEKLWQGTDDSWVAIDIPSAARERLLEFRPAHPPLKDALEREAEEPPTEDTPRPTGNVEALPFYFLQQAPYLPNATLLGLQTCAVKPWPHQRHVVQQTVERFPENFLFSDEVGLGKTIEVGLVLRQLLISGRVKRGLLLVPRSVVRQWQEELYEKLVLNVPRYESGRLLDVFDRPVTQPDSIWNTRPLLLASSQLAKRRDRQHELLQADPWDLVIVDEAHHARRKDILADRFRPNRLLELLIGTGERRGLRDRTRCIYLLTATPMQINPLEIWDLLFVLGMGGRWGAHTDNFLEFFTQLRKPFDQCDWEFVMEMVGDFLESGGSTSGEFEAVAREKLGPVEWEALKELPRSGKKASMARELGRSKEARRLMMEFARRHTPMRDMVWRNTRRMLRQYRKQGLIHERIPERKPRNVWIPLLDNERKLYNRIEDYISNFYEKYEAERKGLGFVMTVYRRRLTSSFYAIQQSLERRLLFLTGRIGIEETFADDDLEQDELALDVSEQLSEEDRERFFGELEYVEDFLRELKQLGNDSKMEQLTRDLRKIFSRRDTILLFTQYTDTMDYIREQLCGVYGQQIACYSGRGGEIWDGAAWVPKSKERIKEAFRQGEQVKILLCTESASEGLNLQTCGVLINFDMPWNPMRVEQRIGRIDRIGQRFDEVWIRNYFYEETVEATVYRRLEDRISWFEDVVGELQPILHRVGETIKEMALLDRDARTLRLDQEIKKLREEVDERLAESLVLEDFMDEALASDGEENPPASLEEIERLFLTSSLVAENFAPHPEITDAYVLRWGGEEIPVTFSPEAFDRYPYSLQFLTYGNPLFDELVRNAGRVKSSDEPRDLAHYHSETQAPLSVFLAPEDGQIREVDSLDDLDQAIQTSAGDWSADQVDASEASFEDRENRLSEQLLRAQRRRRSGELLALKESARQVLRRAAFVQLARTQHSDMFEDPHTHMFGKEAVQALSAHGVPFKGLLNILDQENVEALAVDPLFQTYEGLPVHLLDRKWTHLKEEGMDVLRRFAALERLGGTGGGWDRRPVARARLTRWLPLE